MGSRRSKDCARNEAGAAYAYVELTIDDVEFNAGVR
jgi:hypothetical protein